MRNRDDMRFYATRAFWNDQAQLFIYRTTWDENGKSRTWFGKIVWEEHEEGLMPNTPSLIQDGIATEEHGNMFRRLYKAMRDGGVLPRAEEEHGAEKTAMLQHLQDMREIVFDQLGMKKITGKP